MLNNLTMFFQVVVNGRGRQGGRTTARTSFEDSIYCQLNVKQSRNKFLSVFGIPCFPTLSFGWPDIVQVEIIERSWELALGRHNQEQKTVSKAMYNLFSL